MIYVKAKIVALKTPTWLIKQKLFRDLKFKLFPGLLNSETEKSLVGWTLKIFKILISKAELSF